MSKKVQDQEQEFVIRTRNFSVPLQDVPLQDLPEKITLTLTQRIGIGPWSSIVSKLEVSMEGNRRIKMLLKHAIKAKQFINVVGKHLVLTMTSKGIKVLPHTANTRHIINGTIKLSKKSTKKETKTRRTREETVALKVR